MSNIPSNAVYSISWKLRRVTTEFAFVSVPVADEVVKNGADGAGCLDVDLMKNRAIELGLEASTVWKVESYTVEPHPLQDSPTQDDSRDPIKGPIMGPIIWADHRLGRS